MSKKYKTVKNYFDRGLWGIHRVHNAVAKGWITPKEYETITGETYAEDDND